MSKTKKLAIAAMIAAACFALLYLAAVIGQVRLAVTALAGIFPAAVVIVCGSWWAFGTFAAAGILALLLLPDKSPALWFLFFFGHYPIWKALIEGLQAKIGKPWLGWALKLLGFAVCMALLYFLFGKLFAAGIPYAFSEYTAGPYILVIALLLAFVVYDIAFSILINWFRIKILPKLQG